jgi:DNA modification methylase
MAKRCCLDFRLIRVTYVIIESERKNMDQIETAASPTSMHDFVPLPLLPLDSIICGDNCEVMRKMPSESIDLVVTSPPYDDLRSYGGHAWDFFGVAWNLRRLLKPGGVIVWVVNDKTHEGDKTCSSWAQANHFREIGMKLWSTMIWDKPWCQYGDTASRYAETWEYCFVLSKGKPKTVNILRDRPNVTAGSVKATRTDRRVSGDELRVSREKPHVTHEMGPRKSIWEISQGSETVTVDGKSHPAIFPEALARDHIRSWSNEGDIVLDPFSGSGTTAKMAKHNGRRFIGIEVNPEYVEISEKRLAQGVLF